MKTGAGGAREHAGTGLPLALELEVQGDGPLRASRPELRRVACAVLEDAGVSGPAALGVAFVDEIEMRALNARHRARDTVTDVLSFPIDGLDPLPGGLERQLGDVVICGAQVRRQAAELRIDPAHELTTMLVHGLLHLLGHDHDGEVQSREMLARQERLVAGLPPLSLEQA